MICYGCVHPVDVGNRDERCFLFIKDRLKDMIITGGFNVYPVDVENALGRHPAVADCAVFGIEHAKWGDAVHAAVQLRAGCTATEQELIALAKSRSEEHTSELQSIMRTSYAEFGCNNKT